MSVIIVVVVVDDNVDILSKSLLLLSFHILIYKFNINNNYRLFSIYGFCVSLWCGRCRCTGTDCSTTTLIIDIETMRSHSNAPNKLAACLPAWLVACQPNIICLLTHANLIINSMLIWYCRSMHVCVCVHYGVRQMPTNCDQWSGATIINIIIILVYIMHMYTNIYYTP